MVTWKEAFVSNEVSLTRVSFRWPCCQSARAAHRARPFEEAEAHFQWYIARDHKLFLYGWHLPMAPPRDRPVPSASKTTFVGSLQGWVRPLGLYRNLVEKLRWSKSR
jgi:hypothetical protein